MVMEKVGMERYSRNALDHANPPDKWWWNLGI